MNYFSHGREFLDAPYFLAGTAVPDWLRVVHRRVRVPSKLALQFGDDEDALLRNVARGILQHHHDDRWFHQTRAFAELSLQFTVAVRDRLPADEGFRPSLLGHILVELLLDAALIEEAPAELDRYYAAVARLDPEAVGRAVNRMATRPTGMMAMFIPQFAAARFLYDYLDDRKLLGRLNNVMRRVKLPALPGNFHELFPWAREEVRRRKAELMQPCVYAN
jgi:hypothetical protein